MSLAATGKHSGLRVSGVKGEDGAAPAATISPTSALPAGERRNEHGHHGVGGELFAFLSHEHDRQAVREALPAGATVRFAASPAELRRPESEEPPAAVLAELAAAEGAPPDRILEMLKRLAPRVTVCAYIPPQTDAVREAVLLAGRGLVADVITTGENLGARLKELLLQSRARSENAALLDVWHEWVSPDARDIVDACIDASVDAATVAGVARRLNKSARHSGARPRAAASLPYIAWCPGAAFSAPCTGWTSAV